MKNEVRPIDANALAKKIREYMRSLPASTARIMEYHKVLSMLGDEGQTPTLQLGCNIAATGEPLTLEQLREMDGKPVWVKVIGKTGIRCDGWCEVEIREKDPFAYVWWPRSEVEDIAKIEDYGKGWLAYAYPPAHIDREGWVRVEDDLPDDGEEVIAFAPKQKKAFVGYVQRAKHRYDKPITWFLCGAMGRAYTVTMAVSHWRKKPEEPGEEAWDEPEKRLRGVGS